MTNQKPLVFDKTFKRENYVKVRLPKAEYENCVFESCDFSNGYLDSQNFLECEFIDCNLSNANIAHTVFNDISFSHCKMMGLKFDDLNDFLLSFRFNNCTLNFSSFYQMQLNNMQFINCKLLEVDFTETRLISAIFDDCNLENALFENTVLEKADFRTAYNYNFDPEKNRISKAKFSKDGVLGLFEKYDIVIE